MNPPGAEQIQIQIQAQAIAQAIALIQSIPKVEAPKNAKADGSQPPKAAPVKTIRMLTSTNTPMEYEKPAKMGGGIGTLFLEDPIDIQIPVGLCIESEGNICVLVEDYVAPENLPTPPAGPVVIKREIPAGTRVIGLDGFPVAIASSMVLTLPLDSPIKIPAGTKLQAGKLRLTVGEDSEANIVRPAVAGANFCGACGRPMEAK